ncbi:class I SAM-dependent methyltransferase [Neolewinella lacunae]|uniref:Methyltransferase domain-containing protein n=1 Tax=Neolewinella lacunae TaxID=1517758 RepID=A0A923PMW8_9BACT|nr:class I SAM-dependent methyltransferase [Neolewinella lacunae]MBC6993457.1 methyltransferase domain-containing protein [Neolewinella lacunae]MDN3636267.1 class I SAM-dependent methyltransferase [Neolewinella lacunae]
MQKTSSLRWRVAQYLERRWWRRYLRAKPPEQYLAEKSAYWQRTLDELGWTVIPHRKVLDAGCGPAGIFITLHGTERVTALDPLLLRYETDLSIFARSRYPETDFAVQTLEQPIPGGPFEAIYCFNAINHVANWALALDQLTAVAHTGTRLLLTSDVHRHPWLEPIFRLLPGDLLHPQQHGPAAYRAALQSRGWRVEKEQVLRREAIFDYTAWVAEYGSR